MTNPVYIARAPEPPCPNCGRSPCACREAKKKRQAEPVILKLDRAGRKGKSVTLITGLQMHPAGKEELVRRFRKLCGAGGTLKRGVPEIQGDHRARIAAELESLGYRVKIT